MSETDARRSFPSGTCLFREGDHGQDMYIIVSGRVRISRRVRDVDRVVTTLPPGEFFGELALLNERSRSGTATVIEDSELLVVGPDTFEALIYNHRAVALRLIRRLARRLEDANQDITLLLYRDPGSRLAHALKRFACAHGQRRGDNVHISLGVLELALRLGLQAPEIERVLTRFRDKGLVVAFDEDHIELGDPNRLDRFLDFLDLRHDFAALVDGEP